MGIVKTIVKAVGSVAGAVVGAPHRLFNAGKKIDHFVEKNVIRPMVHHPVRTAVTAIGYVYGGPLGAAAASGAYSVARGKPLREAATQAAFTYAGSYAGNAIGGKLAALNKSGGMFAGRASSHGGGIVGQRLGSAAGSSASFAMNNAGQMGAGLGNRMFENVKSKSIKKSQEIDQEQKSIEGGHREQARQAAQQQQVYDQQIQHNQRQEKRARGNAMKPRRYGMTFGDQYDNGYYSQ